jgi:cobyrinic acid a,c-diamide synthase
LIQGLVSAQLAINLSAASLCSFTAANTCGVEAAAAAAAAAAAGARGHNAFMSKVSISGVNLSRLALLLHSSQHPG